MTKHWLIWATYPKKVVDFLNWRCEWSKIRKKSSNNRPRCLGHRIPAKYRSHSNLIAVKIDFIWAVHFCVWAILGCISCLGFFFKPPKNRLADFFPCLHKRCKSASFFRFFHCQFIWWLTFSVSISVSLSPSLIIDFQKKEIAYSASIIYSSQSRC